LDSDVASPLDPRSLAGRLRARALAFPEAAEDFPWGERAIKVRGKAFLFMRAEGDTVSFSVKLPHSAAEALELPYVEPTHYGLGKHGWVTASVDGGRAAPLPTFRGVARGELSGGGAEATGGGARRARSEAEQ